jgi:hypothetical protein
VLLDADARVLLVEPGVFTEGAAARFAGLLKTD